MAKLANFNVVIKGAIAAACGGAASVAQHFLTDGSFVLNRSHLESMGSAAFIALLLYFAESPVKKSNNGSGQQGG